MGNLHSVSMCFGRLGQTLTPVRAPDDLEHCDALILPGVGAFDPAMEQLRNTGLIPHLREWGQRDRPLLGICLGLQLLFERSEEGESQGLGLFKGSVSRLPSGQGERIPHMGWGKLEQRHLSPLLPAGDDTPWVYFVHSFAAHPDLERDRAADVSFGSGVATAMVWHGRVGACQFHPEKSGPAGAVLLQRWLMWLQAGAPLAA